MPGKLVCSFLYYESPGCPSQSLENARVSVIMFGECLLQLCGFQDLLGPEGKGQGEIQVLNQHVWY